MTLTSSSSLSSFCASSCRNFLCPRPLTPYLCLHPHIAILFHEKHITQRQRNESRHTSSAGSAVVLLPGAEDVLQILFFRVRSLICRINTCTHTHSLSSSPNTQTHSFSPTKRSVVLHVRLGQRVWGNTLSTRGMERSARRPVVVLNNVSSRCVT